MPFTLELDEDSYRIVGPDGEEGDVTDYGTLAVVTVGDGLYGAMMTDAETGDPDLGIQVYRLTPVETATDDVEFDLEVEDDNGTGDDDDAPDAPVGA